MIEAARGGRGTPAVPRAARWLQYSRLQLRTDAPRGETVFMDGPNSATLRPTDPAHAYDAWSRICPHHRSAARHLAPGGLPDVSGYELIGLLGEGAWAWCIRLPTSPSSGSSH